VTELITYHHSIPQPPDSLEELNNVLTDKLKKWDCFDFDVPRHRLEAMKRAIEGRDLEWFDPDLEIDDVITIVVGTKGADFEDHERRR